MGRQLAICHVGSRSLIAAMACQNGVFLRSCIPSTRPIATRTWILKEVHTSAGGLRWEETLFDSPIVHVTVRYSFDSTSLGKPPKHEHPSGKMSTITWIEGLLDSEILMAVVAASSPENSKLLS